MLTKFQQAMLLIATGVLLSDSHKEVENLRNMFQQPALETLLDEFAGKSNDEIIQDITEALRSGLPEYLKESVTSEENA